MSGRELSVDRVQNLDTLSGGSVDVNADYYPVYDASDNKVKRVLAGGGAFGDPLVNATAATLTVTRAEHARKIVALNRAAGITVTLPAATGTGETYTFIVGTTVTSNNYIIKVADASSTMVGNALIAADGGNTMNMFEANGTDDTITMNGTTTGGLQGDKITLVDIATNLWQVVMVAAATGVEADPFSATV